MTTAPAPGEPADLDALGLRHRTDQAAEPIEDTGDEVEDVVVSVPLPPGHDPACWIAII